MARLATGLTTFFLMALSVAGFAHSQPSQPVVVSVSGTEGSGGYYVSCVTVTLQSSGAEGIEYSFDGGQTWKLYTERFELCTTTLITYRIKQSAGNPQEPKTAIVYIDMKPPTITAMATPIANTAGWNNTDVTVSFTCSDMLSGVQKCPSPVTVRTEGAKQVVSDTAVDKAGHAATTSVTVSIDKTPPKIITTGPREAENYSICNLPAPNSLLADDISGIKESSENRSGGNKNRVGTFTYTVTASDNAGNTATERISYRGIYAFEGFQPPTTFRKPFTLGSAIPIAFVLTDGCKNFVSDAVAALYIQKVSSEEPEEYPIDNSSVLADSGNTFWYDFVTNQYIYNLSTENLSVGTWKVNVTLDDGMTYSTLVGIKQAQREYKLSIP
ncbi:MAG: PxKF domain-containing protein [Nitrospirae bacterium]|nr:PxKF domain-containing protein [Nitrospirota bacterium]